MIPKVVVLLFCAIGGWALPVHKRQADPVDAICAMEIAMNATLSYTVAIASDCTKYAQCLPEGGYLIGECSAGTFFDDQLRSCQYANMVQCFSGPCSGQPDNVMVGDPRGCANFFVCNGGVATPMSCPEAHSFTAGSCVPDLACAYVEQTTPLMSPAERCLSKGMRAYPGDNTMYLSFHAGGAEVEMACPPGTVFDDSCSCVFRK